MRFTRNSRSGRFAFGAVAVSPDSKEIYVADQVENDVVVDSATTGALLATVTLSGVNSEQIVASPDNALSYTLADPFVVGTLATTGTDAATPLTVGGVLVLLGGVVLLLSRRRQSGAIA